MAVNNPLKRLGQVYRWVLPSFARTVTCQLFPLNVNVVQAHLVLVLLVLFLHVPGPLLNTEGMLTPRHKL